MEPEEVIYEIRENRKITAAIHDEMIAYRHEQKAVEKRINGLEERTNGLESISEKHTDELTKLKNINVKMLAMVTGAIWLLGVLLKWLFGLIVKTVSIGGYMIK